MQAQNKMMQLRQHSQGGSKTNGYTLKVMPLLKTLRQPKLSDELAVDEKIHIQSLQTESKVKIREFSIVIGLVLLLIADNFTIILVVF